MENFDSRMWLLLCKKLNNEANADELEEFSSLLRKVPIFFDIDLLEKLWKTQLLKNNSVDVDVRWSAMEQLIMEEANEFEDTSSSDISIPIKKSIKFLYLLAACMLLVICIGLAIKLNKTGKDNFSTVNNQEILNEVSSKSGSKSSVILPEGSKVWLNAGSKITYGKNFINHREVYLTGEAYFDVKHDSLHPFTIHTYNVNIKVLGTAFNVKAYSEDEFIETALIRGTIELSTTNDPARKILLRPNEKITISKAISKKSNLTSKLDSQPVNAPYLITNIIVNKKDSTIEDIAWMEEKIVFKSETFEMLSKKMERWYDVTFIFEDARSKNIKFTGAFYKQSIIGALQALQFSCNYSFSFSANKNQIIIKYK